MKHKDKLPLAACVDMLEQEARSSNVKECVKDGGKVRRVTLSLRTFVQLTAAAAYSRRIVGSFNCFE